MTLKLHNYFRSSTSTRLRAALNLKQLDYSYISYALKDGEHRSAEYLEKNPAGLVPALELDSGDVLTQSLAIMEWLEEEHPEPPLLPADALGRAQVRALCYMIGCEIHPVNNLRILQHLQTEYGQDADGVARWFNKWVHATFQPLEVQLSRGGAGRFCHGDTPGMADCCLYAQMWNNKRFNVDMSAYPTIQRIYLALEELEAFQRAAPPVQPDAQP